MKIGIAGAGIVGRLLAWHLCQHCEVHLFCQGSVQGEDACSWMAAGMISPFSEADLLTLDLHQVGKQALHLWPKILATLPEEVPYQANGTIVLNLT